MTAKWEDDEKDHVIGEAMKVSANIEDYKGVIIITRDRKGKIDFAWAGPEGEFDAADVLSLTEIVHEETKQYILNGMYGRKEDND